MNQVNQAVAIRPTFAHALTVRQCTILRGLIGGMSNGAIAEALCLTEYTIKYHCRSIYQHFEVSNRAELLSKLLEQYGVELLQFMRRMPPPMAPHSLRWVAERRPTQYLKAGERRTFQTHQDFIHKRL